MKANSTQPNWLLFGIGILILVAGTIFFRLDAGAFDIAVTKLFYNADLPAGQRFFLAKTEPWLWMKKNDSTFAVFLLVSLIIGLITGLSNRKYRSLVKYSLFGIVSGLLGPGILVNFLFKGYWGRPRPSQTVLWPDSIRPDNLPFYKVWEPAFLDGLDKASFPCGHASIVVIFIVFFYIFKQPDVTAHLFGEFRQWKVKLFTSLKYTGLFIAFPGGLLMGLTRIIQGAHHASDVLWTFGMVLLTNWGLYYFVFKIPQWEQRVVRGR